MATGAGTHSGETDQVLRAQMAVEPDPGSSCAVVGGGTDATEISQHLKRSADPESGAAGCGECHTEITVTDDGQQRRTYVKSSVGSNCICPVFDGHDCIPEIQEVRSGEMVVVVTVPERAALQGIIGDLRDVGATVSVDWIVEGGDADAAMEVDVESITDSQQEAMRPAKELGYYETPREADLSAVADELGISESATSQRLNAADKKLVDSFLDP